MKRIFDGQMQIVGPDLNDFTIGPANVVNQEPESLPGLVVWLMAGYAGNPLRVDPTGTTVQPVEIVGGSGGTSSTFGDSFPAQGTAVGALDTNGNMASLNLDSSGNLKVTGGSGGGDVTIISPLDGSGFLEVSIQNASIAVTNAGTFAVQAASTVADGADVTQGAKADAKSTATDTTPISIMSVLKEISFMEQNPVSRAVTNAGTFAVQASIAAAQTIAVTNAGTFAVQEATLDATIVAQGTSASSKILIAGGKSNDATAQYRELPLGGSGRSVIVEGYAGGTAVPISGTVTTQVTQGTRQAVSFTSSTPADTSNTIALVAYANVAVTLHYSGTVTGGQMFFEVSDDNSNWYGITMAPTDDTPTGAAVTNFPVDNYTLSSAVGNISWQMFVGGYAYFRVRMHIQVVGSGTATVAVIPSTAACDPAPQVTQGITPWVTAGVAASGAAVTGNPVLVAGQDGTDVRTLLTDTTGQLKVLVEGGTGIPVTNAGTFAVQAQVTDSTKATYTVGNAYANTLVSNSVNVSIFGSASKLVKIRRIDLYGVNTSQSANMIITPVFKKVSSVLTGGTSSAVTSVPVDSSNAAATATVAQWSVASTGGGAVVGVIQALVGVAPALGINTTLVGGLVGALALSYVADDDCQPLTLRGTSEGITLSTIFSGGAGPDIAFNITWTEE